MTIAELRERSNQALSGIPKDVLVLLVVLLASTASFGLGVLAGREAGQGDRGIWIEDATTTASLPAAVASAPAVAEATAPKIPVVPAGTTVTPTTGKYVASKNGTKYYLPSCSSANRIKPENRVWFATVEDAEASGRTPASNCPGL
ncbi:MAG: hypothetical protein ACM3TU_01575 [Bacillota bacterium]